MDRPEEESIVPCLHLHQATSSFEPWSLLPGTGAAQNDLNTLLLHDRQCVMAGHYQPQGQPMAGHPDSRFMFHDSEQMLMDSRMHLPPDHFANSAFWYRPDTSLPVVERQEAVHLSHGGMPGIEAVKHRRTRSGCFTCRSRRVKVGNTVNCRPSHCS